MSFECPEGTRFEQRTMVCHHWEDVADQRCRQSHLFYSANLRIGRSGAKLIEDGEEAGKEKEYLITRKTTN